MIQLTNYSRGTKQQSFILSLKLRGQGMSCVFQNIQKCVLVFFYQNKEPFQQACGNCQKIAME